MSETAATPTAHACAQQLSFSPMVKVLPKKRPVRGTCRCKTSSTATARVPTITLRAWKAARSLYNVTAASVLDNPQFARQCCPHGQSKRTAASMFSPLSHLLMPEGNTMRDSHPECFFLEDVAVVSVGLPSHGSPPVLPPAHAASASSKSSASSYSNHAPLIALAFSASSCAYTSASASSGTTPNGPKELLES